MGDSQSPLEVLFVPSHLPARSLGSATFSQPLQARPSLFPLRLCPGRTRRATPAVCSFRWNYAYSDDFFLSTPFSIPFPFPSHPRSSPSFSALDTHTIPIPRRHPIALPDRLSSLALYCGDKRTPPPPTNGPTTCSSVTYLHRLHPLHCSLSVPVSRSLHGLCASSHSSTDNVLPTP